MNILNKIATKLKKNWIIVILGFIFLLSGSIFASAKIISSKKQNNLGNSPSIQPYYNITTTSTQPATTTQFIGNIFPQFTNQFDLGSYPFSWRNIYASGTVFAGSLSGSLSVPSNTLGVTTTYFVDTTNGSDSNACTASGTSACKTIQAAINLGCSAVLGGAVQINVAAGTYVENLNICNYLGSQKNSIANGYFYLLGSPSTPISTIIQGSNPNGIISDINGATVYLDGFTIQSSVTGATAIQAKDTRVFLKDVNMSSVSTFAKALTSYFHFVKGVTATSTYTTDNVIGSGFQFQNSYVDFDNQIYASSTAGTGLLQPSRNSVVVFNGTTENAFFDSSSTPSASFRAWIINNQSAVIYVRSASHLEFGGWGGISFSGAVGAINLIDNSRVFIGSGTNVVFDNDAVPIALFENSILQENGGASITWQYVDGASSTIYIDPGSVLDATAGETFGGASIVYTSGRATAGSVYNNSNASTTYGYDTRYGQLASSSVWTALQQLNGGISSVSTSTTATPLSILDFNGNRIISAASSTGVFENSSGALQVTQNQAVLTVGSDKAAGLAGEIYIKKGGGNGGQADLNIERNATGDIGATLGTNANGGILVLGNGSVTSSMRWNNLQYEQSTGNNAGLLFIDASGNLSTSGTLQSYSTLTTLGDFIMGSGTSGAVHVSSSQQTAPTVTMGGAPGCTAGSTNGGSDYNGTLTFTGDNAGQCFAQVNFNKAWPSAPRCFIQAADSATTVIYFNGHEYTTSSPNNFTVQPASASFLSGTNSYFYHCEL